MNETFCIKQNESYCTLTSEIPKVTIDGHTYSGHYSKTRLACRAITIEEDGKIAGTTHSF